MMGVLGALFSRLGGGYDREDFGETRRVDPRAWVIHLTDDTIQPRDYYDVANQWLFERRHARHVLADVLAGRRADAALDSLDGATNWSLARWIDALPPEHAGKPAVAELRKWYDAWRDGVRHGVERYRSGDADFVQRLITQRSGAWYHAGRRVDACLEAVWTH